MHRGQLRVQTCRLEEIDPLTFPLVDDPLYCLIQSLHPHPRCFSVFLRRTEGLVSNDTPWPRLLWWLIKSSQCSPSGCFSFFWLHCRVLEFWKFKMMRNWAKCTWERIYKVRSCPRSAKMLQLNLIQFYLHSANKNSHLKVRSNDEE